MSDMTGYDLARGWIGRVSRGQLVSIFDFQFNPTEVSRVRNVEYDFVSAPGSALPRAVFRGISGDEIEIELLLDATGKYYSEQEGVNAAMAELESFTQPDIDQFLEDIGQFISPPQIRYGMGNDMWNVAVTSVGFRTVRWNRAGYPTRAYADITMQAIFTDISALRERLERISLLRKYVVL